MTRRFLFITGILTFFALFVQWGLSGFFGFLWGILQILVCSLIATSLIRVFRKDGIPFRVYFLRSLLLFTSVVWFFSLLVFIFIMYQSLFPAAVGKIILSNTDQTLVVYQMSHIATPRFYTEVGQGIQALTASWYIVYAEWVASGSEQHQKEFDQLLGVKMTESLYASLASTIGLVAQDRHIYDGNPPGVISNVDISIDAIMQLIGTWGVQSDRPPIDLEAEIQDISSIDRWWLMAPLMRSVLSALLKNNQSLDTLGLGLNPILAEAILDQRNQHIVDTLLVSDQKKIILVYGALHFEGIYALLQAHDPRWNILSIEPMYPYSSPLVKI